MSTATDIAVSYDVGNDFFGLWLDKARNYSCAVFDGTDDLEVAQLKKLEWIHDAARVTPTKRVLDIGCGWGSNLRYLTSTKGVADAHGITLSEAQLEYVRAQKHPGVSVELVSYRTFEPRQKFDAVTSIGMFEHIARPGEARTGESVALYRDYFRRVHRWTNPGAHFALQTVISERFPRDPKVLREIAWATSTIFPGAVSPRLEVVMRSLIPYWELVELRTRRLDYAKTTTHWLTRLRRNREAVVSSWGKEVFETYERYLTACVTAFEGGYQSLAQFSLRRTDWND